MKLAGASVPTESSLGNEKAAITALATDTDDCMHFGQCNCLLKWYGIWDVIIWAKIVNFLAL
jgi:hypothetical protein